MRRGKAVVEDIEAFGNPLRLRVYVCVCLITLFFLICSYSYLSFDLTTFTQAHAQTHTHKLNPPPPSTNLIPPFSFWLSSYLHLYSLAFPSSFSLSFLCISRPLLSLFLSLSIISASLFFIFCLLTSTLSPSFHFPPFTVIIFSLS